MCDSKNGFRLCTCDDDPFQKPGVQFAWRLYHYKYRKKIGQTGILVSPEDDLGDGLTDAYMLDKLNAGNYFDFDYQPAEKDALRIIKADRSAHLCFVFRNGSWQKGMIDPYWDVVEGFRTGTVDKLPED